MAIKNLYNAKEKEKKRYGNSTAANSAGTAAADTQSKTQNNVRKAEQSTPRLQSNTLQKIKREKSPSELGEEVLALMLREETPKARQPAAADVTAAPAAATAAPAAAPGTKAITGNKKAAPYTGAAASPYTGTAAASYGSTVAGQNAGWNESPSYLQPAIHERATVQPLASARPGEQTFQSTQQSHRFTSPQQMFGGMAGSDYTAPAWQPLAAAQWPTNANTQFIPNRQPKTVAQGLTSVAPGTNDFRDVAYGEKTFDLAKGSGQVNDRIDTLPSRSYVDSGAGTVRNAANSISVFGTPHSAGEDAGPTPAMPDWLALMSTSGSDYPGPTAFANQIGFGLKESAAQLTPGKANQLAPDWLDLMSMSKSDYPGLHTFANPVSPLLRNGAKPLWNNTHVAADTQASKIRIQNVEKDPQSTRIKPESKALPNKEKSDILNKKSSSKKYAQEEWWEKPGASETFDSDDPAYQTLNAELTDNDRSGGLRVVKIDGEYYVDYTTVINTRLHEVEQDFRDHAIYGVNDQALIDGNIGWFIAQVGEDGPWDIKEEPSWSQQFGNVYIPSPWGDSIAYNGQVVTPEKLGNLTYGYLGSAMGWSEDVLCFAGGVVNRAGLAWNSVKDLVMGEGDIWACLNNGLNLINPFVYLDGSYGDGEEDTLFIKKGVELYEAVH